MGKTPLASEYNLSLFLPSLSCPMLPATYPRLSTPMPALPRGSMPRPLPGVSAPSGTLLKDILALQPRPLVENTFWAAGCRWRGQWEMQGGEWVLFGCMQLLAGSLACCFQPTGIERRLRHRKEKKKKIKGIMGSASLKPWQKCSGCLRVICCGKKRMLPFPSFLNCSLHGEACAGALVPGGMCLGCAGRQDGVVRSVWMRP